MRAASTMGRVAAALPLSSIGTRPTGLGLAERSQPFAVFQALILSDLAGDKV